ncbi:translation initiation factor aIF-2, beta subunit, partial [mine drainage metagenome]
AEKSDFVVPKVDALIQGNKTIIRNINAISDKARRGVPVIAHYLTKELGVPVNIESQRILINGKFQSEELDKRIKQYFDIYVICKECKKPDTHIESSERGMLQLVCEACGARYGVKG